MQAFCVKHREAEYSDLIGLVIHFYDVPAVNPKNPAQASYGQDAVTICNVLWYRQDEEGNLDPASEFKAPERETSDKLEFIGLKEEFFSSDDDDSEDPDDQPIEE